MPIRPTRAEIDLGALIRNLQTLRAAAPEVDVLAVVKADAYGHGAVPVSRALEAAEVRFLGVALVEEGLALREAGLKSEILVLGGAYEGGWDLMLAHRMVPVVFRPEHLTVDPSKGSWKGTVIHAEHLGADTNIYLDCEKAGLLTVRVFGVYDAEPGATLFATPDPARTYRFGENGRALK